MPTKDGFAPDHSLPPVLADEPEQQGTGKPRDRAVMWSRVLKASILVATFGVVVLGLTFFADVTASLVDKSALQPGTDQSTTKTNADAEASPPTASDAPPVNPDATRESAPPSDDKIASIIPPFRHDAGNRQWPKRG